LKLWGLLKLFAGGGMLVVLGAAALMIWPLLWPPDPDASVQMVNGRLIGEATGYVGRIDRDTRTVDVSASLLGWRPIVLIVNETTSILVQNRQGGFGDLWKDMPVRVSYEVVGDARLARSIEVVTGDAAPSREVVSGAVRAPAPPQAATPASAASPAPATVPNPPAASPPTAASSPAPAAPPVAVPPPAVAPAPAAPPPTVAPRRVVAPPAARVVEPAPAKPAPSPAPPRPATAPPPATVAPRPVVEPPAARVVESAPAKPALTPPAPTPPPPPRPATAPPPAKPVPPVAQPRSVESSPAPVPTAPARPAPSSPRDEPVASSPARAPGDAGDGAAAIDWLLKERGSR
jgi:hypothetical protein